MTKRTRTAIYFSSMGAVFLAVAFAGRPVALVVFDLYKVRRLVCAAKVGLGMLVPCQAIAVVV